MRPAVFHRLWAASVPAMSFLLGLYGPERRRVVLVDNLRSLAEALAVEHALEQGLGVVDAQVGGEVNR